MNALANALADIVRSKIREATAGRGGTRLESRFIFHGPPLEIMEEVFTALTAHGGIRVETAGGTVLLPVLLQVPLGTSAGRNPPVGVSGTCDESHLLHLRNDPHCPSFVALVPPGQHNNKSVASTTDEFGLRESSNTSNSPFDLWWDDSFIQLLVAKAMEDAGLPAEQQSDARRLAEYGASALDEVDESGVHVEAWRLVSRLFSTRDGAASLPTIEDIALACGMPAGGASDPSSKVRLDVLGKIADAMADGFGTSIDRLRQGAPDAVAMALSAFLEHVRSRCDVTTLFERATAAFYAPHTGLQCPPAPPWWSILTTDCWSGLLADEPDETGDLHVECVNSILAVARGIPAVVKGEVVLSVATAPAQASSTVEVQLDRTSGSARGKQTSNLSVLGTYNYRDDAVPDHKVPLTYKVSAHGSKSASSKVISLSNWTPGLVISCRLARKLSPPKRPTRRQQGSIDWETALVLPGSGRYELVVLTSPGVSIVSGTGLVEDSADVEDPPSPLRIQQVGPQQHQVEIEAEGSYQLDVTFLRRDQEEPETCRAYITCEEASEEGCRSEFERLIKLNRRHLEKLDTKAVVQLDRHARTSSLQTWMLDDQHSGKSFRPIVVADDYARQWSPPDWDGTVGPRLSLGRFLHDPRPEPNRFVPPPGFVEARREIARLVRETDEQSGLVESAPLGKWLERDPEFRAVVEAYLDAYMAWCQSDPDVACWVDVVAVTSLESDGRTLTRVPDAILLSPLHPLRLAWHCVAQRVLFNELEGDDPHPCPAACVLDPDCVPDVLTMALQSPGGMEEVDFISVECDSDYWSVLWNGSRLRNLPERCRLAPFDDSFGISVGGISSGFSSAQVARALEDVTNLLAAKPIVSLVVTSAGGATDACNEGLANWCTRRFTSSEKQGIGPRMLEVYDTRLPSSRPDDATIANVAEDTANAVRWYLEQPQGTKPDLGIIAQLDSAEPQSTLVAARSPLGPGGLIRHRIRRQLPNAFLSESRQGLQMPPCGDVLMDKVATCIVAMESRRDGRVGLQFAPNVNAIADILEEKRADFVAVSSTAVDPACFLGGWINGAYLWDYDLPAYSNRAGDTSGYYLLSQVNDADRDRLRRVLSSLPGGDALEPSQVQEILLEVARRGIPTVRGLSGDDTGATGDLGLFLAVRLLQDQFRHSGNLNSLLQVLGGVPGDISIALVVPVDPFRGYLADLAKSVGRDLHDSSLSRPDLLVVGVSLGESSLRIRLTPIEVKCRQTGVMAAAELLDALGQPKALSSLFLALQARAATSMAWRLAWGHLLLSMVGFGLRVYSQHHSVVGEPSVWAGHHERIAAAILGGGPVVTVDQTGRLIVADGSQQSDSRDCDGDGFQETIVIASTDAGRIVGGGAQAFYDLVRAKVGDWRLMPGLDTPASSSAPGATNSPPSVPAQRAPSAAPMASTMPSTPSGIDGRPSLAPSSLPSHVDRGVLVSVGTSLGGFEPRKLALNVSDTRLNQLNIGVVGDLGTGKTQLLKSLIYQLSASTRENQGVKPRFLIFDYKRDYSSPEFVAATGAKVIRPSRLPLNMFDTSTLGESSAPWLDRFRFFADVLDKVYSGIGPVQRNSLKAAVRSAYESAKGQGRMPTIYDIHDEYRLLLGARSDAPMSIIDDLVDMEIFERNVAGTSGFDEFLDGVVVISLDAMGQDDRSKNLLVAIMLNMFYENMLKTAKRPYVGTDPQLRVVDAYLLVDEADNIMRYEFDVLRKLLLQGREFGTGVILASQYLRHFKAGATDYREPLLTWFIHKVPNVTPSELGALGLTGEIPELVERVKVLANHQCLYKSFDFSGGVIRGTPFYELVPSTATLSPNS